MSVVKKIFIALIVLLVLIQFIRPDRNDGPLLSQNDIFAHYPSSDSVKNLVRVACYDCHSNHTNYPWYTNIQPVGLWMGHHVDEGKSKLNFSEFAAYPVKKANRKLEETAELLEKKEMPISSYTLIHKDADLDDQQRKLIIDWAKGIEVH